MSNDQIEVLATITLLGMSDGDELSDNIEDDVGVDFGDEAIEALRRKMTDPTNDVSIELVDRAQLMAALESSSTENKAYEPEVLVTITLCGTSSGGRPDPKDDDIFVDQWAEAVEALRRNWVSTSTADKFSIELVDRDHVSRLIIGAKP